MDEYTGFFLLGLRLAAALILYAFLGWALFVLWRDLNREQTRTQASAEIPAIVLTTLADGYPIEFIQKQISIGRDNACDYAIANETVSSRHAQLFFSKNQWWVDDLQSKNGTYLNGEKVNHSMILAKNDELRIGEVCIQVFIK